MSEQVVRRASKPVASTETGLLDGKEVLVIDLKYTNVGIYSMAGIRWVKMGK